MKFGDVDVAAAQGAILAHTHRLGDGGALKKGRVLTADDVARLQAAGFETVVAARLDADDVAEDAAAASLGDAARADGVRAGHAATGRCNLYATHRGLLTFDPARVDAVNLVDEAVTVGTLPNFSVVEAGAMVATVKIIPFAVPTAVIDRCRAPIDALLTVRPFRPRRAGLIVTTLPGVHEKQLERATNAQQMRVNFLGGEVVRHTRCAHDEAAVAACIREMHAEGLNPILVMGASAIVDRGDVVPQAIVRAGGELVHMGMPVDPGNLMLLARWAETDIIGVPGCARSLKPSGYDWVLQRLAADVPITKADIMRMGAGGLLNEIRARPLPRQTADSPTAAGSTAPRKIVGVVLAGGQSRRMGPDNKLLADVDGVPMVVRVVRILAAAGIERVIVVTGHEADAVQAALSGDPGPPNHPGPPGPSGHPSRPGIEFVHNPDFADGLSTSLRAGIRALEPDVDGALVALGDMPWVRVDHIHKLLESFDPQSVCVPLHDRKRGHPVLWGSRFFPEFEKLIGDVGARHLMEQHAADVRLVPVGDRGVHVDIDTPEALQQLRQQWGAPTTGQDDVES